MKPNLSDHVKKKFDLTEKDAQGAPVKDIQWEGLDLSAEEVKIVDPGVGGSVVLRFFFFKAAPLKKGQPAPTKQQLFESFQNLIQGYIWKDGLRPLEGKEVRVYVRKELKKSELKLKMIEENADIVIIVPCEPTRGESVTDKHHKLK